MRLRRADKPRTILRGFAHLSLIGTGAMLTGLWLWLQSPSLDTYEDECFMPEALPTLRRKYVIQQYLRTISCRGGREPSGEEQWIIDWLSERAQSIASSYEGVQEETAQLEYMREQCEGAAQRCSGKHAIYHLADCFKRGWNNSPWRERARTMGALIYDRQVHLEAMEGAQCIIHGVTSPFYAHCPPGRLPAILTDADCCYRIQRRGPEVQRLLPMYGVVCQGDTIK